MLLKAGHDRRFSDPDVMIIRTAQSSCTNANNYFTILSVKMQ